MTWTQVYDPLGNWWLSTLISALPIIVLLGLLAGLRVRPHLAACTGAAAALIAATTVFRMPVALASMSFLYGVSFALLKIAWIVVAAVYLYDITVETGQFDIMKHSVASITADRRLQLLLVAFCFGGLMEGGAGFGAPVAIAGAFMIGLGFKPFHAAALNLIANTAPVAFGSIGIPVHTLALVSALPESDLSAMIGRILPIMALLVSFWLVRAMVGWRETFEVLPAILVAGGSFAITQWFWSNYVDSNLVDIAAGAISTVATIFLLRFWQPKTIWRFDDERQQTSAPAVSTRAATNPLRAPDKVLIDQMDGETEMSAIREPHVGNPTYTAAQIAKAWMPFAILSLFVLMWGLPSIKGAMNKATTPVWKVPLLHNAITRAAPVVSKPTPEAAMYDFNWLSATGTACFLAGIVSGALLGLSPKGLLKLFAHTLFRMRFAVIAISFMLGLGYVTRYSGMDAVLGLAFTRSGSLFPFFGTFLGWLGVALTGSDTSSNALFGSLQRITAEQLKLSPVLMCAANSSGGVMGKMVDAQSIVVATAATNQVGNEWAIFRFVVWHSIALAAIVGVIVMLYAYVFPNLIPHGLTFIR